jgi:hypothetical protein
MLATSKVPKRILPKLEKEIKMMFHACRDGLRNRRAFDETAYDPKQVSFPADDGYHGEAFGMLRTMALAGWGSISGPVNVDQVGNLRYWFDKLEKEVLAEENFGGFEEFDPDHKYIGGDGSGRCDYCLARYGKDDAGRSRHAAA